MAWEGEGKVFPRNLALTLPLRGPLPLPPEAGEGIYGDPHEVAFGGSCTAISLPPSEKVRSGSTSRPLR